MVTLNVLKLFTNNKDYYTKYNNTLNTLILEPEVKDLFKVISNYYDRYDTHTFISKDEFLSFFSLEYPMKKDKQLYVQLIEQFYALDTSDSVAADTMTQMIEVDAANKIVNTLLPSVSGERFGLMSSVQEIIDNFMALKNKTEEEDSSLFVEDELDELIDQTATDGLSFRLNCLRSSLGPLSGGTLGHIFARPECGKTTFVHSEVSFLASQLADGETVLWFNNEEAGSRVKLRLYTAVTGMSLDAIIDNKQTAISKFNERGGLRVKLYDSANISIEEIEKLCKEYHPRFVVVDQGDKLSYKGDGNAGNGADRLKQIYDRLREVVKRCNLDHKMDMLTVGQADVQAEGRKWLNLSNLDSGKTGKAGAFDYVIGIGKTDQISEEYTRFVQLCKNKLTGDHGRYVVSIDPQTARYID
jgi:replicative DNA helicase